MNKQITISAYYGYGIISFLFSDDNKKWTLKQNVSRLYLTKIITKVKNYKIKIILKDYKNTSIKINQHILLNIIEAREIWQQLYYWGFIPTKKTIKKLNNN